MLQHQVLGEDNRLVCLEDILLRTHHDPAVQVEAGMRIVGIVEDILEVGIVVVVLEVGIAEDILGVGIVVAILEVGILGVVDIAGVDLEEVGIPEEVDIVDTMGVGKVGVVIEIDIADIRLHLSFPFPSEVHFRHRFQRYRHHLHLHCYHEWLSQARLREL